MNPKKSAVRVFSIFPNPVIRTPIVCRQCENPECQTSCPSDAISVENSIPRIDGELCTNCLACVDACPYGAIFVHPDLEAPIKCDLCGGKPQCVGACPKHALKVTDDAEGQPRLLGREIDYGDVEEVLFPDHDGRMTALRYVKGGRPR
jgi:Fe-S-cluster-containing hydrogenase component 2